MKHDISEDEQDESPDESADSDEDEAPTERPHDSTAQWIPDFVASRDFAETDDSPKESNPDAPEANGEANGNGSWEEPGFVRPTDIRALYATGELAAVEEDEPSLAEGTPDEEPETVTLAEEETASARQRSRSLFWRNDG